VARRLLQLPWGADPDSRCLRSHARHAGEGSGSVEPETGPRLDLLDGKARKSIVQDKIDQKTTKSPEIDQKLSRPIEMNQTWCDSAGTARHGTAEIQQAEDGRQPVEHDPQGRRR
jgi:hypothetical protein